MTAKPVQTSVFRITIVTDVPVYPIAFTMPIASVGVSDSKTGADLRKYPVSNKL